MYTVICFIDGFQMSYFWSTEGLRILLVNLYHTQVLVKHGALIAISNKYGDMPLTKARPRLRKKLEGMWQGERDILL